MRIRHVKSAHVIIEKERNNSNVIFFLFQDTSSDKTHKPHTPADTTHSRKKSDGVKPKNKTLPHDTAANKTHPQKSDEEIEVQNIYCSWLGTQIACF